MKYYSQLTSDSVPSWDKPKSRFRKVTLREESRRRLPQQLRDTREALSSIRCERKEQFL